MVSKIFYSNTNHSISNAGAFADRILESKQPHLYSLILQNDEPDVQDSLIGACLYQCAVMVLSPNPVHSEDLEHNHFLLFLALAVMVICGENYFVWCRANQRIAKLQKELETIHVELREADPILKNKVESVFQKQMNILNFLQRESVKGMALQSLLCTSILSLGIGTISNGCSLFCSLSIHPKPLLCLFEGILTPLKPLFRYGAIGALMTGSLMYCRARFSSKDEIIKKAALEIKTISRSISCWKWNKILCR